MRPSKVPPNPDYSWLGQVPEDWQIVRFRNVFSESQEKIEETPVGDMLSVSGYRGIEVKDYDDENRRRLDEELVGYRIVRVGQLVVNTMWLNYAGLGVSEFEGHVSPAYRAYNFKIDMDKRFAHYLLRSSAYVKGYTRNLTGIRPNSLQMSRDNLMSFPVLIPPLPEQFAIAAFLDRETAKIDALIEVQKRLIELLKEKRQAVISQAVTKGLNPSATMKDSGIEWLGDVPEHWDFGALKRFWNVLDCKHITAEFVDDGYPLASIRECQGKFVDLTEAKQTTIEFYRIMIDGGRKPLPGDLIFTRNATVGAVAQVENSDTEFAMGQDVCLLRKSSLAYSTNFMQFCLEANSTVNQLANLMIGSTFKRINVEEIKSIQLCMPPPDEQEEICRILGELVQNHDEQLKNARIANQLLLERLLICTQT